MIGILVPAHNEEACLEKCLHSLTEAARHPDLKGEPVRIVVVLDDCSDSSTAIAARFPVSVIETNARNVGKARALGADWLIDQGARWIACTDADSQVPANWLASQLVYGADAVCGVVEVDDWTMHSQRDRERYDAHYQDSEGHRHIHGANFGVSTEAYLLAGGFPELSVNEDVDLVERLQAMGKRIAWSCLTRVRTSARLDSRAKGGFGDYLKSLEIRALA